MRESTFVKKIQDAVLKAGRGLSRDFGELENLQVSKKGPADFVTSADLRSEQTLIEELLKICPKASILGEESGAIKGENENERFIIDPLDGTKNFMHGLPHFCISVAYEKTLPGGKKDLQAAVIFAPALNELYWAEKNVGAFCGNRRLQVSGRTSFDSSLIAGYFARGSEKEIQQNLACIKALGMHTRVMGSAAMELAYVAAGKLDGFWHSALKPWDMAAGVLLVREARGLVCDIGGGADMMEKNNIIATNQGIHDALVEEIRSQRKLG